MAGSNPSAAEWFAQVPLDTGFVMGTSTWRNYTLSCGIAVLVVCERSVFFFAYSQNTVHTQGHFLK